MVRLGGTNAGLEGLLKLGGAERGVGIEPLGADLGAEATVLGDLFLAITERRELRFAYHGGERRLKPFGMGHRRGHWYVVGEGPEGERLYRVDRMSAVQVGEKRDAFKRPRKFDVKKAMSNHPWEAGTDDVVTALVRFDPDVAWWAGRTLGVAAPDGSPLECEVPVANRDAFIGWVLSFGDSAEVLGPEELREDIAARVDAALESSG
jgi:predicted DNA-binding transcriptional regulator YafY